MLGTPALALGQAAREALRASDIVREMLVDSVKMFQVNDGAAIAELKNKDNIDRSPRPSHPVVYHEAVLFSSFRIADPPRHRR